MEGYKRRFTTQRMKKDGMTPKQISRYTGLTIDEVEGL